MITIFMALYPEARPLIKRMNLQRETGGPSSAIPFEEYVHRERGVRLVLTGVGHVAAAVAVGSICTAYGAEKYDFFFNIGTCAATEPGKCFLCHQIVDGTTGRTYYPDMLYRHSFSEASVITVPKKVQELTDRQKEDVSAERKLSGGVCCYDMEAAGFYEAASRFAGPHQIACLKVASDTGDKGGITSEDVYRVMEERADDICRYIKMIRDALRTEEEEGNLFSEEEEGQLARLCEDMHCSETMRASLRQLFRYVKLSRGDWGIVQSLYERGMVPCRDKREGKKCLDELRRELL